MSRVVAAWSEGTAATLFTNRWEPMILAPWYPATNAVLGLTHARVRGLLMGFSH
jgi:hypothetical protein